MRNDKATRSRMALSFGLERQLIVSRLTEITIEMAHWNDLHPDEVPLKIALDFNLEVEGRIAGLRLAKG